MNLLRNGPPSAPLTLVLAHGAGTPMDHPFLAAFAEAIGAAGFAVVRFEFPYMAARREDGKRRAPDREPVLLQAFHDAASDVKPPLVVGGKSMGGRIASMVAGDLGAIGLLVLGYPFHPTGRPERTRVAHLAELRTPALIIQGTRDPFGTRAEVETYRLSPSIRVHWIEGGNHDLATGGGKRPIEATLAGPLQHATAFLSSLLTRSG
ncbi:MAG: alpha/beta hydrolase [Anaerolinea sp.]|nr:alpha/beta hydrolase [Anaerolinea sp.]